GIFLQEGIFDQRGVMFIIFFTGQDPLRAYFNARILQRLFIARKPVDAYGDLIGNLAMRDALTPLFDQMPGAIVSACIVIGSYDTGVEPFGKTVKKYNG